jgi:hypothetical protein
MRVLTRLLPVAILALLAACAPRADVASGANGRFGEARSRLLTVASKGPVPFAIDEAPPVLGGPDQVMVLAQNAIAWSNARLTMAGGEAPAEARLLLAFAQVPADSAAACAGRLPTPSSQPRAMPLSPLSPVRVHAIFCDNDRVLADVIGTARTAGGSSTGGGWFPGGVSLGVGVGSGGNFGGGIGVGF